MQFSGKTQSTLVDHIVQDHRDITCACYWGLGSHILLTGPQAHDDQQGVDSQTDCSNHFLDLRHRSYSDSTTVAQQICGVGSPTNLTLAQTSCLETNCKRLHTGYSGHWGLGSHYTLTGLPEYSFHAGIRDCAEFYIGVGSLIFDSLAPFLDTQQLSNNTFASEEHQFSGVGSLLFDSLAQFLHSAQPHFFGFCSHRHPTLCGTPPGVFRAILNIGLSVQHISHWVLRPLGIGLPSFTAWPAGVPMDHEILRLLCAGKSQQFCRTAAQGGQRWKHTLGNIAETEHRKQ